MSTVGKAFLAGSAAWLALKTVQIKRQQDAEQAYALQAAQAEHRRLLEQQRYLHQQYLWAQQLQAQQAEEEDELDGCGSECEEEPEESRSGEDLFEEMLEAARLELAREEEAARAHERWLASASSDVREADEIRRLLG